ncbi:hypothetical protein N7535_003823 [Penicillium sp. DV-2018c]|nr:hypothetical protein N7461_000477 [Penicillium sp. DV-2018c]KAJ5576897.1 hypothetical protein N7535_003823 [Penicillium sp. DV-2018c]
MHRIALIMLRVTTPSDAENVSKMQCGTKTSALNGFGNSVGIIGDPGLLNADRLESLSTECGVGPRHVEE